MKRRRYQFLALIGAAAALAFIVGSPSWAGGWLFLRYARACGLSVAFVFACAAAGHRILRLSMGSLLPLDEQLSLALPLGVLAFFFVSFAFGVLGWYGTRFFIFGPALLVGFGGGAFSEYLVRWWRRARHLRLRPTLTPLRASMLALGVVGLVLVWLPTLLPQNASYDARWYHLPIAENYVAHGGIRPYPEGWILGAYPQLASLLDVWAFSAPGELFDRVELAAQLEAALFVATLLGVAASVRRLLGQRAPFSWSAMFLFPGVFCYDSGLVLGADHVAALFAAPMLLLGLRHMTAPRPATAALLGACLAGALNSKYSAVISLPLPLWAVLGSAWQARARRGVGARSVGSFVLSAGALTAPHWLKNLLYYGDPLFPLLRAYLPSHPWQRFADTPFAVSNWRARPHALLRGLIDMFRTFLTFSFEPHEYFAFHGQMPVFGSLFTLSTPLLWLWPKQRRLRWLFGATYLGMAVWFWVHAFDRYLQMLVPWMAAGTAAVIALLWQRGPRAQAATALVVGLQVVWGSQVPFLPTHGGVGGSILKAVVTFIGARERSQPLIAFPDWQTLGAALPSRARVLVHEEEVHAGLAAGSVMDYPGDQGLLYWGEPGATTPREIWHTLKNLGVTHVIWAEHLDHGADTVAGGLTFFDFVSRQLRPVARSGGFVLAALPETPPPEQAPGEVAYYPCAGVPPFAPGLYRLPELARFPGDAREIARPRGGVSLDDALSRADFVVWDASCRGRLSNRARTSLKLLAARGTAMLFARRSRDAQQ